MTLLEQVEMIVERETGARVAAETRLEDLPIDSLEFLELIQAICGEVGGEIPDEQLSEISTVGDVAEALALT